MALNIDIALKSANAAEPCGDAGQIWTSGQRAVIAIADGLGHGRDASVAAKAALAYVGAHLDHPLRAMFLGMHEALKPTRGAAVAVAMIEQGKGEISYAAVGNTRAAIFGWRSVRLDANPGIVGGRYRQLSPVVTPFLPGNHLVLWTDGVDERLSAGPREFALENPANSLLSQFLVGNDDAFVIVARFDPT